MLYSTRAAVDLPSTGLLTLKVSACRLFCSLRCHHRSLLRRDMHRLLSRVLCYLWLTVTLLTVALSPRKVAEAASNFSPLADHTRLRELDKRLETEALRVGGGASRSGVGIIYFIYFGEDQKKEGATFLYLALASARSYRKQSATLNIAVAISDPSILPLDHAFTHVLTIPRDVVFAGRQWLTRVLSLTLSPFELTLAVDSDTLACGDLTEPLLQLLHDDTVDFAASAHHPKGKSQQKGAGDWLPDAGVLLYRWSPGFRALRTKWVAEQIKQEEETGLKDDQGSLQRVVYRMKNDDAPRCKVSRLTTAMSCRLRPAPNAHKTGVWSWNDNDFWHTMLLTTKIYVLHMNGAVFFADDICALVNKHPTRPRVLTYDNRRNEKYANKNLRFDPFAVALSSEECAQQLEGNCSPDVSFAASSLFVDAL